jgi:hypothetical protein
VQRPWRRSTWRLFRTAVTSKHFIEQVENEVEGHVVVEERQRLGGVARQGDAPGPPGSRRRRPCAAAPASTTPAAGRQLRDGEVQSSPASCASLHEQQPGVAPGWNPRRSGMVAPAPRRAPLSPPFFFPPLLLFSSSGQGQNPQVAAVDRELRLGIRFIGRR